MSATLQFRRGPRALPRGYTGRLRAGRMPNLFVHTSRSAGSKPMASGSRPWLLMAAGGSVGGVVWYYYRDRIDAAIRLHVTQISDTLAQWAKREGEAGAETGGQSIVGSGNVAQALQNQLAQLPPDTYRLLLSWTWLKPAVYLWGSNEHGLVNPALGPTTVPTTKPYSTIPQFDGRPLRQLAFGPEYAVAVDEHGDLYQWGQAYWNSSAVEAPAASPANCAPERTLCGKDIRQVALTWDKIFALSRQGELYVMAVARAQQSKLVGTLIVDPTDLPPAAVADATSTTSPSWLNWAGSWLWPLNYFSVSKQSVLGNDADFATELRQSPVWYNVLVRSTKNGWKPGECPVQVAAGDHHVCLVTSHGRVWTAATDGYGNQWGQLGHRDEAVEHDHRQPNHTLPLVRFSIVPGLPRTICQVACGARHTVARTTAGDVYGFGANDFGQLAMGPYAEGKVTIPWATAIPTLWPRSGRPLDQKCTAVAAGGDNTYFVVQRPNPLAVSGTRQPLDSNMANAPYTASSVCQVYASGAGQSGKLGNGQFTHVQGVPVKIKPLSDKTEYNEDRQQTVPICIDRLICGPTHALAVLHQPSTEHEVVELAGTRQERALQLLAHDVHGRDVLAWGSNVKGQCQSLKGGQIAKPTPLSQLTPDADQAVIEQDILASLPTMPRLQLSPFLAMAQPIAKDANATATSQVEVYQDLALGANVTALYHRIAEP
ncbi:hypothetical protein H4R34_004055 [Dimargaris verticillata]|uniref:Regulator of chromosome condensation 1/beta-lactamase-inhibitor protein II n=1 Tax=Dimargaris verticillata TaxID=2761393 RepID=A0A9W8AZK6_9FUNG|nr:hypothetical protein H4R34_004055 [Dimargaris verticillata]